MRTSSPELRRNGIFSAAPATTHGGSPIGGSRLLRRSPRRMPPAQPTSNTLAILHLVQRATYNDGSLILKRAPDAPTEGTHHDVGR
jgi:hypothetical protein